MWKKLQEFFKDSETIAWARLQAVLGAVAVGFTYVDPQLVAPLLTPKGLLWYMLLNGVFTEYLRRRRT